MKWIALLDCNNFFVSCERLFRPDLAKQPVVVLSSNDGCVVARSQEVKDMGIPMGVPHFKVKDEFKRAGVVVFSSNFTLYRDISARVMRTLREEVEHMSQYSVDEAFFTLEIDEADLKNKGSRAVGELQRIKAVMEQKVGVPVSIGVARTKTLAKVANHMAKKGPGVLVLTDEIWQEASHNMIIGELWGVGRGLSERFTKAGITTPRELMQADPARISQVFGVVGSRLQNELLGRQATTLDRTLELQHSIMSTRSFGDATNDLTAIERALAHHIEHAVAELRDMGGVASTLRILVQPSRFSDFAFQGIGHEVTLDAPSDDTRVFLSAGIRALRDLHRPGVPYKKAGAVLSGITDKRTATNSLFAPTLDSSLMSVIDTINQRFGPDGVTFFGGNKRNTLTKSAHHSGQPTTRWQAIPSVKAN